MGNYNRDDRSGGRKFGGKSFGGGNKFGGRGGDRQMHQAVCSECGNSCEVPFRPTGDRPVFCSVCFDKQGGRSSDRSTGRDFSKPSFGDKRMFKSVCVKCGNECEVPFKPTSGKPVFCNNCFDRSGSRDSRDSGKNNDAVTEKLNLLSSKLDTVLRLLNEKTKEPVAKKVEVKVEDKKPVVEVKVEKKTKEVAVKAKSTVKKAKKVK